MLIRYCLSVVLTSTVYLLSNISAISAKVGCSQSLPRFIPDYVLKQVDSNLEALPKPVEFMVRVLKETGMRISELLEIKIDCLRQDSEGDYWLYFYQTKTKKEVAIYASKELATAITNQQEYIKQNLGDGFHYLFCQTNYHSWFDGYNSSSRDKSISRELNFFQPIEKKMRQSTIRGYLHELAVERKIKDETGRIFPLEKCHQFRHTHGTELINNGVPQHIVQKRLRHKSADMTSVYAHIHNRTMKAEMDKFWDGKVVNNKGEVVVPENPDLDTAEMQWVKKNMKAQTLADGFCGLPVTKTCPAQDDPCSNCSFFRTTRQYLETHKNRLEETEKLIENARKNCWERQVEKNLTIAENLRKIIRGLEQKDVIYGDEKFPEQQLEQRGEQSA